MQKDVLHGVNTSTANYLYTGKMSMKLEEWRKIRGFKYYISSYGRIKSCARSYERIINGHIDGRGYKKVMLWKNKKEYRFSVHRLVAMAFIDNPLNKPKVNHIDGNKLNNNLENLEWATCSEDSLHMIRTGLANHHALPRPYRKKKIEQYTKEGKLIRIWDGITDAAKETKILITSITNCLSKRSNLAGGYKWNYHNKS